MQLTQQFRGLDPKPVPPEGSVIIGQHTDGRPIYELRERAVVGKKPKVINGEEQWRKHRTTGEKMHPINERIWGEKVRVFVLEPCKNGNVIINTNFRNSPEDEKRIQRKRQVEEFHAQLAEQAIERGLTPEDVLDKLTELATAP